MTKKLDPRKPIPSKMEVIAANVISTKMKGSSLPNNYFEVKTGGSRPMTLTKISVARKDSDLIAERTLRARTKQSKEVFEMISGKSEEATSTQASHFIQSFDQKTRQQIIAGFKCTMSVPPDHVAAMKSTLNLPWNLLRDISRWLKSFNINLAPEGKSRAVVKEWVADSIRCEEIPALVLHGKKTTIELRAWCYIYNLVAYVLRYLDDLFSNNKLYDHPFIPATEIHLKIGGDHGGKSFKMSCEVGNVENPNKVENTFIFSIAEAKDYKSNLMMCLQRFISQIEQFKKITWHDKVFKIFMFGDYEFLTNMYGLSGASGRYPCLWCEIPSAALSVPKSERDDFYQLCTLDTLKGNHLTFVNVYNSNLKNAKQAFNVIDKPFFNIDLEHVCVPGLHITLGVYLKLFNYFELYCKDVDMQIAYALAEKDVASGDDNFNDFINTIKAILKLESKIGELEERHNIIVEELNWFALSQSDHFDEEYYIELLHDVEKEECEYKEELKKLKDDNKLGDDVGPCQRSVDKTLKDLGVERQAYFGGSFIGNHCDKLLKDKNVDILCSSLLPIINHSVGDGHELHDITLDRCEDFKLLFKKYGICHRAFNSASELSGDDMDELERNILDFMMFLRSKFPDIRISPKLHILEDHVVPFIRRCGVGSGFYGEQGGESIHKTINSMKHNYSNIKNPCERLKYIMCNHLAATNPNASSKRVVKKKRNLKRTMETDK